MQKYYMYCKQYQENKGVFWNKWPTHLTHLPLENGRHFGRWQFQMHFLEWWNFELNFIEICSQESIWQ